ncbi:MAG: hypothetical protein WCI38_10865 [Chthoniobacterales bacterium]|jgi:hypothetical protein
MPEPENERPEKSESVVFFDMSDQLAEELKRRARETGNTLKSEVEKIIKDHVEDTT